MPSIRVNACMSAVEGQPSLQISARRGRRARENAIWQAAGMVCPAEIYAIVTSKST